METDAHEFIEAYLAHLRILRRAKRTIAERRRQLHQMDRDRTHFPAGLDAATQTEIKTFVYRDELAPSTVACLRATVVGFFDYLTVIHPVLDFNPAAGLPRPQVPAGLPRPTTDEQTFACLERLEQPYRLWAWMAGYQGMRCCEIAACDTQDVGELDTYVHGKGSKARVVPTDPEVWQMVAGLPAGPVARLRDGTRANAHYVSNMLSDQLDRVGLPEITAHRLRHWYGTRTLDECGNLRTVQELMGHASPASTAIYTLVSSKARRAAVRALPRPRGVGVAASQSPSTRTP